MVKRRSYKKKSYRKKSYRRKKTYKRQSKVSTNTNMIGAKCIVDGGIFAYSINNAAVTVMWGSNGTTANNGYVRLSDNNEFSVNQTRFKYWKLTGMKIKYFPLANQAGATDTSINIVRYASSIGDIIDRNDTDNYIKGMVDYKTYQAGRAW